MERLRWTIRPITFPYKIPVDAASRKLALLAAVASNILIFLLPYHGPTASNLHTQLFSFTHPGFVRKQHQIDYFYFSIIRKQFFILPYSFQLFCSMNGLFCSELLVVQVSIFRLWYIHKMSSLYQKSSSKNRH